MRKLLLALLALSLLAIAPFAAGCGADDLSPESVAEAAEATRDAKTARVDLQLTASGLGSPIPLSFKGKGVTALDGARMDLTFDLAPLLALGGIKGGDGKVRTVVDGKDVFVKIPSIEGFALPGGADWITLDIARAAEAAGIDAENYGKLLNVDPAAQIRALTSAKGIEEVGEEEVGGAETTHFRGTIRVKDLVAALPPAERAAAQKAADDLLKQSGGDKPQPLDVWIDGDNHVRRMKQTIAVPAQQGVAAGKVGYTIDYSDFGTALNLERPAAGDVFDATSEVTKALRSTPGLQGN